MKYCKNCKMNVDGERDYCPLCFRELSGESNGTTPMFAERSLNEHDIRRNNFITKLFTFMTICAVSICLIINFMVNPAVLWSLTVASGILYVWVLVAHTIISKRSIFEKVLFQLLSLILILFTTDMLSKDHSWFPEIVFPSVSMCATSVLLMIIFIKKDKSWMFSFLIITVLLTIASLIVMLKLDNFKLVNVINIVYCALIVLGYLIFGWNSIKQQFSKIFYL